MLYINHTLRGPQIMTLDEAIEAIQVDPETRLSAEARNTLHGCTTGHPWCNGKSLANRKIEARMAIAGRQVNSRLAYNLERALS